MVILFLNLIGVGFVESFWATILLLSMDSTVKLSRDMRFPTMWYVRPAKPQIRLRIRAV